ncbi:pantothenate transporter [Drepanopeziza brunnea f. sp. 'multigermtubi' MB_m1]|uniref:Pantothenate transporter n=1 Tax=Marssonina brunnea f. sp. multigermtubi (strain MB_m1) TaxID=1072389 RepID=K1XKL6_MARBU|nr:pantothenate transporter [Drepanopeziza brunnea f. sp. 'multigermtubi' MB_m1]EKD13014.1 pantothenate transporter [Drepanopeziza brunnea f. sp. 'multigermtubi' MB_m1]
MSEKVASITQDVQSTGSGKTEKQPLREDPSLEVSPLPEDWTEAEEKALVKKLDVRIIPMMAIVFALSLIDRANISAAYISGMNVDLDLTTGNRYTVTLLVFFPTYALFEFPSNLIIRRVGARLWLGFLVMSFGAVVFGMGFVKNWRVLAVLRALLGAAEAGQLPGCVYLVASWYRTFEMASRISIFYMCSVLALGFGGLIAYGFQQISVGDGMLSQGWRWIYIIEGMITVVAGAACLFTVPQFAEKATWLTDRERYIAKERLIRDRGEKEYKKVSAWESAKHLLDPKLLVLSYMYLATSSSAYSINFFFPIILTQGLGFKYTTSLILTSTPYFCGIIAGVTLAWISDKYRTRYPIILVQTACCIIGLFIINLVDAPGVRLVGIFITVLGVQNNA